MKKKIAFIFAAMMLLCSLASAHVANDEISVAGLVPYQAVNEKSLVEAYGELKAQDEQNGHHFYAFEDVLVITEGNGTVVEAYCKSNKYAPTKAGVNIGDDAAKLSSLYGAADQTEEDKEHGVTIYVYYSESAYMGFAVDNKTNVIVQTMLGTPHKHDDGEHK